MPIAVIRALLLLGLKSSARPADAEHPLGHGLAIYFWSFIVALMLFSMGGLFSIYEGIHKMGSNEPLREPWIAIGVLLFSIAAEGVTLWKCLTQINALRGEQSLWRWFRATRQSELLVVLGEDVAATLGLSLALVAIAMVEAINSCERASRDLSAGALAVFRARCEKINPMSAGA